MIHSEDFRIVVLSISIMLLIILLMGCDIQESTFPAMNTDNEITLTTKQEDILSSQFSSPIFYQTFSEYSSSGFNQFAFSSDYGYVCVGWAEKEAGDTDVYMVKTDAFGNKQWSFCYGGDGDDRGAAVIRNDAGNFVIFGQSTSPDYEQQNILLFSIDNNGQLLWQNTIECEQSIEAIDVVQLDDDGYALIGNITQSALFHTAGFLMKTDSTGNMDWDRYWKRESYLTDLIQTANGDLVICGWDSDYNAALFLFDQEGTGLANVSYGPGAFKSIWQLADGSYIVTGHSGSGLVAIYNLTTTGEIRWSKIIGESSPVSDDSSYPAGNSFFSGQEIRPHPEGGFIVAITHDFYSFHDNYLWKMSSQGDYEWDRYMDIYFYQLGSLEIGTSNSIVMCGTTSSPNSEAILLKTN